MFNHEDFISCNDGQLVSKSIGGGGLRYDYDSNVRVRNSNNNAKNNAINSSDYVSITNRNNTDKSPHIIKNTLIDNTTTNT